MILLSFAKKKHKAVLTWRKMLWDCSWFSSRTGARAGLGLPRSVGLTENFCCPFADPGISLSVEAADPLWIPE